MGVLIVVDLALRVGAFYAARSDTPFIELGKATADAWEKLDNKAKATISAQRPAETK